MEKIDLRKELKHLYAPSPKKVELVEVPEFLFVMIDGKIEPGQAPASSPDFHDALQALYGLAYTLKFASKLSQDNPIDYAVMALEALWSVESGVLDLARPDDWTWTAMMLHPDHITEALFQQALIQLRAKRPSPALDRLRLERFREGLSIQTLHVGPYSEEPATIERMKAFARENGLVSHGRHHEIYLGDPRRTAPEKLKTVLRQPVQR